MKRILLLAFLHVVFVHAITTVDTQKLNDIVSKVFHEKLSDYEIQSGIFSAVQNDRILMQKGFGYANLVTKTEASPTETLYRIASVSKLITATAIMQLLEQGKLRSLDDDFNMYITNSTAVHIPYHVQGQNESSAVTVRHLLTHTSGFEDTLMGLMCTTPSKVPKSLKHLLQHLPQRVRPLDTVISYCNHCFMLLGLLIEELSQEHDLNKYCTNHIFSPLGMLNTTFDVHDATDPVTKNLYHHNNKSAYHLATTFELGKDGTYSESEIPFIAATSAGSAISTAADMSKFMMAFLRSNNTILRKETIDYMHKLQFTQHPKQAGVGVSFFESYSRSGKRLLTHGGDWMSTSSFLMLLPEENFGAFFSYTHTNASFRLELMNDIIDGIFPVDTNSLGVQSSTNRSTLEGFSLRAQQLIGSYAGVRRGYSNFEKLSSLFLQAEVSLNKDQNSLVLTWPGYVAKLMSNSTRWTLVEEEPYLFRIVAFDEDETRANTVRPQYVFFFKKHGISYFSSDNILPFIYEKVEWHESTRIQYPLGIFSLGMMALHSVVLSLSLLYYTLRGLYRMVCRCRKQHKSCTVSSATKETAIISSSTIKLMANSIPILLLLQQLGSLYYSLTMKADLLLGPQFPLGLRASFIFGTLNHVTTLVLITGVLVNTTMSKWKRLYYFVVAVGSAGLLYLFNYWKMDAFHMLQ